MTVIFITWPSFQRGYEHGCTEARRTWKNLIKVGHWEDGISVNVDPKKGVTGALFITLSVLRVDYHALNGTSTYFDSPVAHDTPQEITI